MAVKSAVKRLCAALVACVVMWYTLITAPCFGVHAASLDGFLDAVGDFVYNVGSYAVSKVLEPLGPVGDLLGITIMSVADQPINAMKNDDAIIESVEYDLSSTTGMTCPIHVASSDDNSFLTCFTTPSLTISKTSGILHDLDYMPKIRLMRFSGDTKCDVYIRVVPYTDGTWPDGEYITFSSSTSTFGQSVTFQYYFEFHNSSGAAVARTNYTEFIYEYADGRKTLLTSGTVNSAYIRYRVGFSQTSPQTIAELQSSIGSPSFRNDWNFGCYQWNDGTIYAVGNVPNSTITFPAYSERYINYNNTYDYLQNYNYPYVVNNYPVYNELAPPSSFLPPEETTSPGSGVIIIDPFTLPPEWVQSDVVELETDHYTVPFESMVADPFDYLVSPYTETVTETVRGATKSVPISPPTPTYKVWPSAGSVQETAVGFINLGYSLLNNSGLDWVIGVAVFGLVCGVLLF